MPVVSTQKVTVLPAGIEVAAGNITALTNTGRKGINELVGQSNETIMHQGDIRAELYANPLAEATGQQLKVVSTSDNDTDGGGGHARRVRLTGLGPNAEYQEEFVPLNGTTQVTTTLYWTVVELVQVVKVGAGGDVNDGDIIVYANDGNWEQTRIKAGEGSGGGAYAVCAAGKALYITGFNASVIGQCEVSIFFKRAGKGWVQRQNTFLQNASQYYQAASPIRLEAGDSVEIRARSLDENNAKVCAVLEMVSEDV